MIRTRRWRMLCVVLALAIVPVAIVLADQWAEYTWVNPCVGGLSSWDPCGGEPPCREYWCEAEWDGTGVWDYDDGCIGEECPETPGYHYILKSNTGTCDGGPDDGEPCSTNTDCSGVGTCEEVEQRLEITLTGDETIYGLIVETEATAATTDSLTLDLYGTGGNRTLSTPYLTLDATYGTLTFTVSTNADFETD